MRNQLMLRNRFSHEIDRMFDDFFGSPLMRADVDWDFMPRVNIKDTKDNVVLTFEVPGIDKKDIKVAVKDNMLTVSGERKVVHHEESDNFLRNEIVSGKFSRSFSLPEAVDPNKIQADYRNGMLEIKLTKTEEAKPKEIDVQVQ
jgi:HSP20 family protein